MTRGRSDEKDVKFEVERSAEIENVVDGTPAVSGLPNQTLNMPFRS